MPYAHRTRSEEEEVFTRLDRINRALLHIFRFGGREADNIGNSLRAWVSMTLHHLAVGQLEKITERDSRLSVYKGLNKRKTIGFGGGRHF